MKKLLFTAYSLDVGGIETALVNLLQRLDYKKYEVTLILEKKEGIFLDQIPKEVQVMEYKISNHSFILFRKIYNRLKLLKWKMKLRNKFAFSCSFATYSIPGAHLALVGSQNNTLWMHGNYYILYNQDEKKKREFLYIVKVSKFKRLVFVSEENLRDVCRHYEGIKSKSTLCNNFIDGEDILKKSKEKVSFKRKKCPLFINVGRHEEHQKRLSRIIEASKCLVEEGYDFQILFIGDGADHVWYKEMVKSYQLEDVILFLGRQKNPFPYYKLSDAVLLSSAYEGYPVVFLEALILGKPILSTKVSDWNSLDNVYGRFCLPTTEGVYQNMKKFLEKGFSIKSEFDYEEYNLEIEKKLEKMIENK